MIDDHHGVLMGIYREASKIETVKTGKKYLEKKIFINDSEFTLKEQATDNRFVWKLYDDNRELSREEIVSLYAYANLTRQMKN